MSHLHRPALRTTIGRVAVAGAATLATVFAVAPVAFADDVAPAEPTDSATPTEVPSEVPAEVTPSPEATAPTAAPTTSTPTPGAKADDSKSAPADKEDVAAAAVVGDFGSQKFRVGVQIADGSYVDEDATTIDSTFRIVIKNASGRVTSDDTCTTTEDSYDEDTSQSFCNGDLRPSVADRKRAAAKAEVTDDNEFVFATYQQQFILGPGESATITQIAAAPGLTKASDTVTIAACRTDEDSLDLPDFPPFPSGPLCSPADFESSPIKITKVVFNNTGPLPIAVDDKASTTKGKAVSIDVLDNDTSDDPDTRLSVSGAPDDGRAVVTGDAEDVPDPEPTASPSPSASPTPRPTETVTLSAVEGAGNQAIRYIPRAGFTGKDTFRYTLRNSNGSDTATVTVTVKDGVVSDANVSDGDALLPNTGGADPKLLGYAGLLLAGGGWLTLRGRRRTADASVD